MKTISSRQNPDIKALIKLHTKKGRVSAKKFIAEGFRTCKTLIDSGHKPVQLFVTEQTTDQIKQIAPPNSINLVSSPVMEKISQTKTPSGILGVFNIPKNLDITRMGPGIVLTQITDPGNMGTLIRSCAAMGFKTVVTIDSTDPWSHKVIQASAGQIAYVEIFQLSWEFLVQNKQQLKLIALTVKHGKNASHIDLKQSLLVIGSEAHGIPEIWLKDCDEKLTLKMPGGTESLNAAVAGSIALYLAAQ